MEGTPKILPFFQLKKLEIVVCLSIKGNKFIGEFQNFLPILLIILKNYIYDFLMIMFTL